MPLVFLNAVLLAGLAAIVVPPVIHLLTRRRFDVAPWAAMQFLDPGRRTRRRVLLDEFWLMMVRMALLALVAVGLAAPAETAGWFAGKRGHDERDFVAVIDQSGSMAIGLGKTDVLAWFDEFRKELGPADRLAVVRAGPAPTVVSPPSSDFDAIRESLQALAVPRGGCNSPAAFALARQLLADSRRPRTIVVVTDGQRFGWADAATEQRWAVSAAATDDRSVTNVAFRLAADRPTDLARWGLQPLRSARSIAIVDRPVTIRSELRRLGTGEAPRPAIRLTVDGESAGDIAPAAGGEAGQPIEVRRTFSQPGSHWLSLRLFDAGNNEIDRQELALDVMSALPVLIVDGDDRRTPARHGVEFLREALAPSRDPNPGVILRVVSGKDFDPLMLGRDLRGPNTQPAVLLLADVPRLTPAQNNGVIQFLESGGGVLVALGDRADADFYSRDLFRAGRGWLPVSVGPWSGPGDLLRAAQPIADDLYHAALELFRGAGPGTLSDARFARWRTVSVPSGGNSAVLAHLTGGFPFLVEGRRSSGRVIVATVPLDDSGPSNVVELPAYAPLLHELVAYLAGARTVGSILSPGQPFVWTLPTPLPREGWTLTRPDLPTSPATVSAGRIVVDETWQPGVYALRNETAPARYFVVSSDPAEHDLTPLDDSDREKLGQWLPGLRWINSPAEIITESAGARTTELGWIAFVVAIVLLCTELGMTRRRALAATADLGQTGELSDGPLRAQ